MIRSGDFFRNKAGQLTIFIIVAVVVVALPLVIYFFFPSVLVNLGILTNNPQTFMQNCIEDEVKNVVERVSLQGGSLEPRNYILYNDEKIEYLCYTEQFYLQCVMQQPLLKQHIENEISEGIKEASDLCFQSLEESFKRQGYEVNLVKKGINVELLPKIISVTFENDLTLSKGETQRFEKISVVLNNNLYELIGIANSILNWEARYGDAETTIYMGYYHDLKVEKKLQSDGSTIYILTDRNTGNVFQFASRSVAWPPGYGIEGIV